MISRRTILLQVGLHDKNPAMRFILLLYFLIFFSNSSCQIKNVEYDYNNGRIYAKGKILTCPGYNKKYPTDDSQFRKTGKWIYYYQNGNIQRIEKYKRIKDCGSPATSEGQWEYFNEEGILIKKEEYKNGVLWSADIAKYYLNYQLAGEILVRDGIRDTLKYIESDGTNLIKNGDFNLYFGPPQLQIGDGQKQIEKQIPFWFSPDNNTPDYYNQFRVLKNIPDNQGQAFNESDNYVGIILYHRPTGKYSEYVTGEFISALKHNKKYCLKIRIRLSQNAGFYLDRVGVFMTDSVISFPDGIKNSQRISQVSFSETLDNMNEWKTLCASYAALGNEKYITLGTFNGLNESTIKTIDPVNESEGDYNQSAYYIIDRVELVEDTADCNCKDKHPENVLIDRINFDLINSAEPLLWNKTYVLKNIFFDFDKSELLPASFEELEKLLAFLKTNHATIIISGHTDNSGSDDYNKRLSLSRAGAVSEWLINNGIAKERTRIEGFGAEMPIVDNDTEENRAINRRVEFKIEAAQ
jgi:outer membrane protein OmpA-like peptidoglycan-associated protein